MKKTKRFKQSMRDTLNGRVVYVKNLLQMSWTTTRLAYALQIGELYEWVNDVKLSARILYK